MNRLLLLLISVVLSFTSCAGGKAKKDAGKKYAYPVPEQHVLNNDTNLIRDHFYMIGWSEDGKLAYVNEPGDEACGCYFMDLYVQDAGQGKILYRYHFTNEDQPDGKRSNDNLTSVWRQKEKIFTDSLNYYGIIPGNFILKPEAIAKTGRGVLRASVSKTAVFNKDWNINTVPEYRLLLHGHDNVLSLYTSTAAEKTNPLMDVYPAAIITAPSGNYAAVVLARQYNGWEGPPCTLRYEVYTCRFK